jgi:hypothetical protein
VIMKGGRIIDNKWTYSGNYTGDQEKAGGSGIHLMVQSSFTMTDGEISGHSAFQGGGIHIGGYCSFTLEGGIITGNEAIHTGAGVLVSGYSQCTIKGGYITNNTALNRVGGGLELGNSTTGVMEGGFITGNTSAWYGGGVFLVNSSSFTMKGGEITDNTTGRFGGGGIAEDFAAEDSSSGFRMEGGIIARNQVVGNEHPRGGGGVLAKNFTMTGGTIYGANGGANANSDNNKGAAAVYLYTIRNIGPNIHLGTPTSINNTITSYPPQP